MLKIEMVTFSAEVFIFAKYLQRPQDTPLTSSVKFINFLCSLKPGDTHWLMVYCTGMLKGLRVLSRHFWYIDGWLSV